MELLTAPDSVLGRAENAPQFKEIAQEALDTANLLIEKADELVIVLFNNNLFVLHLLEFVYLFF